ncbi:unnamed protein product [Calypogeia fissa]
MTMTGVMMVAGHCAGGITAAALTTSSTCSPVDKNSAKLCLQCSGLRGTAQFKTVIGATSKTALFSPSLTLSQNSFRLCVRAAQRESEASSSKVVVIDNYDSFTYNLCQYLGDLGCDYEVVRNDEITIEELKARKPRGILVSPGPGTPQDSGISLASILHLGSEVPIFGVCMGLQCMGEAFGGKIVRAPNGVVHGKTSPVYYDENGEDGLLAGLPNPFIACRYHSLVIEKETFPHEELEVTAWTEDGLIMGVRHRKYKHIQGVQFHPESIITQDGKRIVANFMKILDQKDASACAKEDLTAAI